MKSCQRIVIPVDPYDGSSWSYAAKYADLLIESDPSIGNVILLQYTKGQFRDSSLAGFLGRQVSKALINGRSAKLPSGATLRLETKQTLSHIVKPTIIIVFYASDKILEFVDSLENVAGVVVVPDIADDLEDWIKRWSPHIHGATPKPPEKLLADPLIENAMLDASGWINKANNVLNTRDAETVETVLRILRANEQSAEPSELKSWAIQNGWKVGAAKDLEKLAKKVFGLKTKPRLSKFHDPKGRFDRWSNR